MTGGGNPAKRQAPSEAGVKNQEAKEMEVTTNDERRKSVIRKLNELFAPVLRGLDTQPLRYRYYELRVSKHRTRLFAWYTQPLDGWFTCVNYEQTGEHRWEIDDSTLVRFRKRSAAKARAFDRYLTGIAKYSELNARLFARAIASGDLVQEPAQ